jgi:translation initiation factor IF-2
MFGLSIEDTQCGFKMFTAEAAQAIFAKMATKAVLANTKGKYPAPLEALKVILKADVQGSVEALRSTLDKIPAQRRVWLPKKVSTLPSRWVSTWRPTAAL